MVNIDFSVKNIKRCLCPGCPVQKESICAEGKRRIMLEIAYSSESGMYFERDGFQECTALPVKHYAQTWSIKKIVSARIARFIKNTI